MPLPRSKEARKAAKGRTKTTSQRTSMAIAPGVASTVTLWRNVGRRRLKPKTAQSPRASDPKHKGKGKGVKGKKGAPSLDEWPGDQSNQTPSEKAKEYAEVARLFIGAVNRRAKCSRRDWLTWNRIQEQAQRQWKSYKSGHLGANAVDAEMGEGIDLTIDSFCAACALLVGVASCSCER